MHFLLTNSLRVAGSTLLLAGFLLTMALAEDAPTSRADLFEQLRRASFEILVDGHQAGGAAVIDARGFAVTAAHVIGSLERKIEGVTADDERMKLEVLAVDIGHDVALLKLPDREGPYPALRLADEPPRAGEDVFLFGPPMYRPSMLKKGMVARHETDFEYYGEQGCYAEIRHVDATVQHGTSGGPWVNEAGALVGVQSGAVVAGNTTVGVSFMAPVSAVRRLLATRKSAATATIGSPAEELWQHGPGVLKRFPAGTEGIVLRIPLADGPADRAGLKQWDLLTAIDATRVLRVRDLLTAVRKHRPGETVRLSILAPDGAEPHIVEVELGRLEADWK